MQDGERWQLLCGDSALELPRLPAGQFDALCCDPPAGINFMQARFDSDRGGRDAWVSWLAGILAEARRALKPGAYGFVWALPKTSHWTGLAVEQAGFEVRDILHDVLPPSTLLDQFLGSLDAEQRTALDRLLEAAEPSRLLHLFGQGMPKSKSLLKPAAEHWFLVRNPGPLRPLRIDDCRIPTARDDAESMQRCNSEGAGRFKAKQCPLGTFDRRSASAKLDTSRGRWPAHLVLEHAEGCRPLGPRQVRGVTGTAAGRHYGGKTSTYGSFRGTSIQGQRIGYADADGMETVQAWECAEGCPVKMLDEKSGVLHARGNRSPTKRGTQVVCYGKYGQQAGPIDPGDSGTASRFFHQLEFDPFFYQAKASRRERDLGCEKPGARMMELRSDLTEEERDYVLAELAAAGVKL